MPKKRNSDVFRNQRQTMTEQSKTGAGVRRKNLGFGAGDSLYSASKTTGDKVSNYKGVSNNAPTDKGAIRNGKNIRTLMKQLDRIRANSDGSERHQRMVERAERAVSAYAAYQSLGGQG